MYSSVKRCCFQHHTMRSAWLPVFQKRLPRLKPCALISWDKMATTIRFRATAGPSWAQILISGVTPTPGTVGIHKASTVPLPALQDALLILLYSLLYSFYFTLYFTHFTLLLIYSFYFTPFTLLYSSYFSPFTLLVATLLLLLGAQRWQQSHLDSSLYSNPGL